MLTYCFESAYVPRTLARCRKNDLAVVDTEGREKAVREAVNRDVWVYGMSTARGQTVLYDILKDGTMRYCRYDGGRSATSLSPSKIDGWVILTSAGGEVTHTVGKDSDEKIILIPVEEETPIDME